MCGRSVVTSLLVQAGGLLATDAVTTPEARRCACWLARAALEDLVRQQVEARGLGTGHGSMRSLLTCLEVATSDTPDLARSARYAWLGLSQAAHHHAYELAPTVSETRHLVGLVDDLQSSLDTGLGNAPALQVE
jgi:hypothetical protein